VKSATSKINIFRKRVTWKKFPINHDTWSKKHRQELSMCFP